MSRSPTVLGKKANHVGQGIQECCHPNPDLKSTLCINITLLLTLAPGKWFREKPKSLTGDRLISFPMLTCSHRRLAYVLMEEVSKPLSMKISGWREDAGGQMGCRHQGFPLIPCGYWTRTVNELVQVTLGAFSRATDQIFWVHFRTCPP